MLRRMRKTSGRRKSSGMPETNRDDTEESLPTTGVRRTAVELPNDDGGGLLLSDLEQPNGRGTTSSSRTNASLSKSPSRRLQAVDTPLSPRSPRGLWRFVRRRPKQQQLHPHDSVEDDDEPLTGAMGGAKELGKVSRKEQQEVQIWTNEVDWELVNPADTTVRRGTSLKLLTKLGKVASVDEEEDVTLVHGEENFSSIAPLSNPSTMTVSHPSTSPLETGGGPYSHDLFAEEGHEVPFEAPPDFHKMIKTEISRSRDGFTCTSDAFLTRKERHMAKKQDASLREPATTSTRLSKKLSNMPDTKLRTVSLYLNDAENVDNVVTWPDSERGAMSMDKPETDAFSSNEEPVSFAFFGDEAQQSSTLPDPLTETTQADEYEHAHKQENTQIDVLSTKLKDGHQGEIPPGIPTEPLQEEPKSQEVEKEVQIVDIDSLPPQSVSPSTSQTNESASAQSLAVDVEKSPKQDSQSSALQATMENLNGLSKRIGSEAKSIFSSLSTMSGGSDRKAGEMADSPSVGTPPEQNVTSTLSLPDSVLNSITGSAYLETIPAANSKEDDDSLSAQSGPTLPHMRNSQRRRPDTGPIQTQYDSSVPSKTPGIFSSWLSMFGDDEDDDSSLDDDDAFCYSDETSIDGTSTYDDGSTCINGTGACDDKSTNIGASSTYDDKSTIVGQKLTFDDKSPNNEQPEASDEKLAEIQDSDTCDKQPSTAGDSIQRPSSTSGEAPSNLNSVQENNEVCQPGHQESPDPTAEGQTTLDVLASVMPEDPDTPDVEASKNAVVTSSDQQSCEKDVPRITKDIQDEEETHSKTVNDLKTGNGHRQVEVRSASSTHENETVSDKDREGNELDVLNPDVNQDHPSIDENEKLIANDMSKDMQIDNQKNPNKSIRGSLNNSAFAVDKSDPEEVASVIAQQAALALSEDMSSVKQNQTSQNVSHIPVEDHSTPTMTKDQALKADAPETETTEINSDCSEHPFELEEAETQNNKDGAVWSCGALFCHTF